LRSMGAPCIKRGRTSPRIPAAVQDGGQRGLTARCRAASFGSTYSGSARSTTRQGQEPPCAQRAARQFRAITTSYLKSVDQVGAGICCSESASGLLRASGVGRCSPRSRKRTHGAFPKARKPGAKSLHVDGGASGTETRARRQIDARLPTANYCTAPGCDVRSVLHVGGRADVDSRN
jgi:hypothetical protein